MRFPHVIASPKTSTKRVFHASLASKRWGEAFRFHQLGIEGLAVCEFHNTCSCATPVRPPHSIKQRSAPTNVQRLRHCAASGRLRLFVTLDVGGCKASLSSIFHSWLLCFGLCSFGDETASLRLCFRSTLLATCLRILWHCPSPLQFHRLATHYMCV